MRRPESSDRANALVAVLVALPVLLHPPSLNQGVYLYLGQTVLEGGVLYRDAFEPKGPLLYLVYAALQVLLPTDLVPAVLQLATCVLAGLLAGRIAARFGGVAGPIASGLAAAALPSWTSFAGASASPMWSGEAEDLTTVLGLAGVLVLGREGRGRALLAGGLFGLGLAVKQTHLFVLLAVATGLVGAGRRRELGPLFAGAAAPLAAVAGGFWAAGALDDLVRATVLWPLVGYRSVDPGAGPLRALGAALELERSRLLGLALLGLALTRSRAGLVRFAFGGALASAIVQGRGWPYHFEPALGYGAVLGAGVLAPLVARLAGGRRWRAVVAAVPLAAAFAAGSPRGYALGWGSMATWVTRGREVARASFTDTAVTEGELRAFAKALRARSAPGDGLFVWGMHARLHVDTGLEPPGKLAFALPLVAPSRIADELRAETRAAFDAAPPRFVVYTADPTGPAEPPLIGEAAGRPAASVLLWDGRVLLPRFPGLHRRLVERYRPVERVGRLVLLERRNGALESAR